MAILKADAVKVLPDPSTDIEEFIANSVTVEIHGEIDSNLSDDVIRRLRNPRLPGKMLISISSVGGSMTEARDIANAIRELNLSGREVRIKTLRVCYSAALLVLLAVPVEHRYSHPSTKFMVHGTYIRDNWGQRKSTLTSTEQAERYLTNEILLIQPLLRGTRVDRRSLRQLIFSQRDEFLTAGKARDLGFVSAIV